MLIDWSLVLFGFGWTQFLPSSPVLQHAFFKFYATAFKFAQLRAYARATTRVPRSAQIRCRPDVRARSFEFCRCRRAAPPSSGAAVRSMPRAVRCPPRSLRALAGDTPRICAPRFAHDGFGGRCRCGAPPLLPHRDAAAFHRAATFAGMSSAAFARRGVSPRGDAAARRAGAARAPPRCTLLRRFTVRAAAFGFRDELPQKNTAGSRCRTWRLLPRATFQFPRTFPRPRTRSQPFEFLAPAPARPTRPFHVAARFRFVLTFRLQVLPHTAYRIRYRIHIQFHFLPSSSFLPSFLPSFRTSFTFKFHTFSSLPSCPALIPQFVHPGYCRSPVRSQLFVR